MLTMEHEPLRMIDTFFFFFFFLPLHSHCQMGISGLVREGVYACVMGPSFETAAEANFLLRGGLVWRSEMEKTSMQQLPMSRKKRKKK